MRSALTLRLVSAPQRLFTTYANRQYVLADVPPATTSIFNGANPAVQDGDVAEVSVTSPGGYLVTPHADGSVTIDSGGDASRQTFTADIFQSRRWSTETLFYDGNHRPQFVDPDAALIYVLPPDVAITPVDLMAVVTDADSDTITITSDAYPSGYVRDPVTGIVTGAAALGTYTISHTWTDIAGEGITKDVTFVVSLTDMRYYGVDPGDMQPSDVIKSPAPPNMAVQLAIDLTLVDDRLTIIESLAALTNYIRSRPLP